MFLWSKREITTHLVSLAGICYHIYSHICSLSIVFLLLAWCFSFCTLREGGIWFLFFVLCKFLLHLILTSIIFTFCNIWLQVAETEKSISIRQIETLAVTRQTSQFHLMSVHLPSLLETWINQTFDWGNYKFNQFKCIYICDRQNGCISSQGRTNISREPGHSLFISVSFTAN